MPTPLTRDGSAVIDLATGRTAAEENALAVARILRAADARAARTAPAVAA